MVTYLSRVDLFKGLSEDELQQLNHTTPLEARPRGTVIASPYTDKVLYIIKSGSVRLYKITEDGKELTLDILGTGHLFGEITSFRSGVPLFAVTMEDSVICEMDSGQFRKVITEKPELALKYIEIVTARLQETEDMLEYMAYGSVRKRLLFLFNKLVTKFPAPRSDGGWIPLPVEMTHQELASMTGSIRETVTPILNQLADEGILRKEGNRKPYWIQRSRLQAALSESK